MSPEDVKPEWVEKAARGRFERHFARHPEITWEGVAEAIRAKYLASAADYLAAVLPEALAEAWADCFSAVTGAVPGDVWFDAWDDIDNPYREGSTS